MATPVMEWRPVSKTSPKSMIHQPPSPRLLLETISVWDGDCISDRSNLFATGDHERHYLIAKLSDAGYEFGKRQDDAIEAPE